MKINQIILNDSANEFIELLKSDSNVQGIILFGSWARGNNHAGSDIDLVVIVNDGNRRYVEKRKGQVFEIVLLRMRKLFSSGKIIKMMRQEFGK